MEHTITQNGAPRFGGRAPLFSQRDLLRLVGPLLVEQLLAVTVGMADTMMVSRCGEAAISGVSLVDMINNLIIVLFAALATGGAVVVSQYLGAKEQKHANASSGQLILLSALLGVGVGVFCFVLARPMIRLCYGSIDADVLEAGVLYLRITAVSYPFLAMYNAGAALFRSMGNSKISMQISILMNIICLLYTSDEYHQHRGQRGLHLCAGHGRGRCCLAQCPLPCCGGGAHPEPLLPEGPHAHRAQNVPAGWPDGKAHPGHRHPFCL